MRDVRVYVSGADGGHTAVVTVVDGLDNYLERFTLPARDMCAHVVADARERHRRPPLTLIRVA